MVKTKNLIYGGLTIFGLGIVAYIIYLLRKPAEWVTEAVDKIFRNVSEAGEYLGTLHGLNQVATKMERERRQLLSYMTNSAKINDFYINSWSTKYRFWYTGLRDHNDYVRSNSDAYNIVDGVLSWLDIETDRLYNLYVKNKIWDDATQLPPQNQWPEFIKEVVEERIAIP